MPNKKASRAPARRAKTPARAPKAAELSFPLDPRKEGLEPILGAAYLLMDRAYASLDGDKVKSLTVTLRPKGAAAAKDLAALKRAFLDELAAQKLRWAVARNNQPVREYVAENALALAEEFAKRAAAPAEPAAEQLTSEQRSEIERLIAEVETEISAMNVKKELPDPAGKSLSWEAAQETGKEGSAK